MAGGVGQSAVLMDLMIKQIAGKAKELALNSGKARPVENVFEDILQKAKEHVAFAEPQERPAQLMTSQNSILLETCSPSLPDRAAFLPDCVGGRISIGLERYTAQSQAQAPLQLNTGQASPPAAIQAPVILGEAANPIILLDDSISPLLPDQGDAVFGMEAVLPETEGADDLILPQFLGNEEDSTAPALQPGQPVPVVLAVSRSFEGNSANGNPSGDTGVEARFPVFVSTGAAQQNPIELPTAPPGSVPHANSIADQVVQGVRFAQHAEATELHVHLKPEFLGRLSIRLISDIHGVRMEIKTENEMVRQIMQDNLPDLQQRLADKGIPLDHLALLADSSGTPHRKQEKVFEMLAPAAGIERERVVDAPEARLPARLSVLDYLA